MEFSTLVLVLSAFGVAYSQYNSDQKTERYPPSCRRATNNTTPVVLEIQPHPGFGEPFKVLCDRSHAGGGWIVIQQRFSGAVDFYRGWTEYENGFGNITGGEFWLGLNKIYQLTYSNRYELNVLMEDWDGKSVVAAYSRFLVAGPEEKYKLRSLGQFSGTTGDSLSFSLGMPFSTLDHDNDPDPGQFCARNFTGAWWFKDCHESNLNGQYMKGMVPDFATMMCWKGFRGHYYGLKVSRMLIREVQ